MSQENINPDHYAYRVFWSEEDGEFVGQCAEFASLSHLAADKMAALDGITALVRDVVQDMQAAGEAVPVPLSIKNYSGNFVLRVPPETHRRLALEAAEQNVSLNRLVAAKL
jgi:predicted HicB family RNase H-like nuclease